MSILGHYLPCVLLLNIVLFNCEVINLPAFTCWEMSYISHCHLQRDVLYFSLSPAERCVISLTVTCWEMSYISHCHLQRNALYFSLSLAEKCFISLIVTCREMPYISHCHLQRQVLYFSSFPRRKMLYIFKKI